MRVAARLAPAWKLIAMVLVLALSTGCCHDAGQRFEHGMRAAGLPAKIHEYGWLVQGPVAVSVRFDSEREPSETRVHGRPDVQDVVAEFPWSTCGPLDLTITNESPPGSPDSGVYVAGLEALLRGGRWHSIELHGSFGDDGRLARAAARATRASLSLRSLKLSEGEVELICAALGTEDNLIADCGSGDAWVSGLQGRRMEALRLESPVSARTVQSLRGVRGLVKLVLFVGDRFSEVEASALASIPTLRKIEIVCRMFEGGAVKKLAETFNEDQSTAVTNNGETIVRGRR